MSQYPSQISAANSVKADFVLGESGTASCSGIYGLSDSFAAGLWLVDWVLTGASFGMKRVCDKSLLLSFFFFQFRSKGQSYRCSIVV